MRSTAAVLETALETARDDQSAGSCLDLDRRSIGDVWNRLAPLGAALHASGAQCRDLEGTSFTAVDKNSDFAASKLSGIFKLDLELAISTVNFVLGRAVGLRVLGAAAEFNTGDCSLGLGSRDNHKGTQEQDAKE